MGYNIDMKSKIVIILITVLAMAGTAVALLGSKKPDSPTASQTQNEAPNITQQTTGTRGKYVDYTNTIVAETEGQKILFFYAPWCPQCRALEKSIKEGQIPENVTIIKVDYDSNQSLRQKYGVTIQTSLVKIDDQGNSVEKYVAYDTPTLDAIIKNLL